MVGTRSFGKGSVQTIVPLGANGAIRLTTARYYTPSGVSIQAKGITPDIEFLQELPEELRGKVETEGEAGLRGHLKGEGEDEEGSGSQAYVPPDPKDDAQLNFALDLLNGVQVAVWAQVLNVALAQLLPTKDLPGSFGLLMTAGTAGVGLGPALG